MYGGMYGGMGGLGMGGLGMGGLGMGGMGSMGGMGMGGLGMGGMYGSSGMYGGNMYGSSGMYGSGGGMMGNSMMGNGGMLGNNNNGLLGDNANSNTGLIGNGHGQQQGGILPPGANPGDNPASPINQVGSPLPPLNETAEEKGRRIRAERRKERQLIKQQREQRKQIRMQARMEIAGHLTNVLVQSLRSTMELFAVCFGTYYSMKAVRAFANSQEMMSSNNMQYRRGPMGQLIPVNNPQAAAKTAVDSAASAAAEAKPSRWRTWLLFGALFLLGEVLYTAISRSRQKPKQIGPRRRSRVSEDEFGNILTHDELDTDSGSETPLSLYGSEENESDGTANMYRSNAAGGTGDAFLGGQRIPGGNKRLYVAAYDYQSLQPDGGYLSFKAGDEFVVEDYVEGSWCEAIPVSHKGTHGYTPMAARGLVPSNFLRPLEHSMKL